jgi:hypothetical protein
VQCCASFFCDYFGLYLGEPKKSITFAGQNE